MPAARAGRHLPSRLVVAIIAVFMCPQVWGATIGVPENVGPWGLSATLPPGERGIYADLADAMAARTDMPLAVRFVPYGRMLQEVKSGEVDYAFGVVSPATSEAAPFKAIVGKVPMVAVARPGLTLTALTDLRGYREVGFIRGGSCGAVVDQDTAINRVAQDSYESAIRKMAAGRLDAWCSIKPGFTYALHSVKMEGQTGPQLDYGEVRIGFKVTAAKADSPEAAALSGVVEKIVSEVSESMASAVARQTETTREIAGKVGAVAGAMTQSAQAIRHVATIADEALSANQGILSGAAGIGQEATVLRAAVEQFLETLHADSEERRRFERAA